jgi:hypothetical protein
MCDLCQVGITTYPDRVQPPKSCVKRTVGRQKGVVGGGGGGGGSARAGSSSWGVGLVSIGVISCAGLMGDLSWASFTTDDESVLCWGRQ